MTVRITETVWLDHDNLIDLQCWKKGPTDSVFVEADFSSTTRMVLELSDGTSIDYDTSPGAFDWSAGDGKVTLDLGGEDIDAGTYTAALVSYDPVNTDGIVWGEFTLVARA